MEIKEIIELLDKKMQEEWELYLDQHVLLNEHRGVEITDKNIPIINDILQNIQDTYARIHHAFHFIMYRNTSTKNAMMGYNDFINSIKDIGAIASEPEKEIQA